VVVNTADGTDYGGQVGTVPGFSAFVNLYAGFTIVVAKRIAGVIPNKEELDFPTVDDGLAAVRFTNKVVGSSRSGTWVKFRED
jgi:hypothetical protein